MTLQRLTQNRTVFVALIVLIAALYSPVMNAYFQADDFTFVGFAQREIQNLMQGRSWDAWFIGGVENYSVFRPIGRLFWLVSYLAFGLDAPGYHLATILFQLIASFAAFLLARQLTRDRATAALAALIFAAMPVHAEAVAWIAANYDVLSGMYFFIALIFYILYMQKRAARFYWIALGVFLFAVGSKETAITLPLILFLYDFFFQPQERARIAQAALRYAPFWIIFAWRFIFFGHGYRGLTFTPEGWQYYVDLNLVRVVDPIVFEWHDGTRWLALIGALSLIWILRARPVALFALVWIPITLIPTLVGGVSDRSFYIPSFGVALLLALVLMTLFARRNALIRASAIAALCILFAGYGANLFARNQAYARASDVARAILERVQELHPTFSPDARLIFIGVPDLVPEGAPVFSTGLTNAVQMIYHQHPLTIFRASKFPMWFDQLERTFFFQVDRRRVIERAEVREVLQARQQCETFTTPVIVWNFAEGVHDWEEWNELERFEIRAGALATRALGADPYMASPAFDIPALALGDVEIEMRVRADPPSPQGTVFWLAAGQADFQPGLSVSFAVRPDGEFHTYRLNLAQTGMLFVGDRITRLRVDPMNSPGEIAIKTIRVLARCSSDARDRCACPR
ncbi:MAG: hypothetical protein HZC40_09090 [Chloroflexi bacterium]|nr:hypothetical protein [Chloroflexota bacterium]